MKHFKFLLISFLLLCMSLTSCTKPESEDSSAAVPESVEPEPQDNGETAETAMNNFLKKVEEGNYTILAEGFLKTSVYSNDLVWFDYLEDLYDDFTVMRVNDEVFRGVLTEDSVKYVSFLGEGLATDAIKSRLLNYWLDEDVSQGNIYNLFFNQQDEPLTFVSHEDIVKQSLISFAGYGDSALRLMEDVYLEMDDVDPSEVHLKAVVNDDVVARIFYDDIDITVTFGNAEDNAVAEAWISNPVYPEAKENWDDADIFVLNSVFLPGYGEEAVPFPAFASYAMKIDEENFVTDDAVYIRDSRASESDMEEYINLLVKEGFTEAEDHVYRRLLREDYQCYSSIAVEYDNGVNLTANKYYDFPVYDGLDAANTVIEKLGYPALPSSENFENIKATDTANELTESWLYFFTYDSVLYVDMDYQDYDAAVAYIEEYEKALADAGFSPKYIDDTDEVERYDSENEFLSFQYHFGDDNNVSFLFKAEKYIQPDEAEKLIQEAGFPPIELQEPIACRNLTQFEKMQYGLDYKLFLALSQTFENAQAAEEFLTAYETALTDLGYGRISPDEAGTLKQIAICNEEEGMMVAIDFFEQEENTLVNFDFRAE
ncbi:MAG: hypothetical protein IKR11_05215 [Solobacterium sp.]|nr:hypothetical protein [Solobacterium sp.]